MSDPSHVDRLGGVAPAELEESALDEFAERLETAFKAEPKLNEKRAHAIAVEVAREVFDTAPVSNPQADWSAVTGLLCYITDSASPAVTVDAIAHSMGLIGKGELAMQELGDKHGITRQAFSKHCLRAAKDLRLPTTSGMRTLTAKRNYQRVQRSRWREIEQDRIVGETLEHDATCEATESEIMEAGRACPICGR